MTTEREAFDDFCKRTGRHPDEMKLGIWQAACAWQREHDAQTCEQLGMATNGIYERNQECADKIRSGA